MGVGRPIPASSADFAGGVEVIEKTKGESEAVMVGRYGLRPLIERRVPIAAIGIAQYLVVCLVLFDDVDDVMNPVLQEGHGGIVASVGKAIIAVHLFGEFVELATAGNRDGVQLRLLERIGALRAEVRIGAVVAWVRAGVALECRD